MSFLLRKPWYARPKSLSHAESDVDRDDEGAEAVENPTWLSTLDSEQNEAAIGIPDATRDGDLSGSNTPAGASAGASVLEALSSFLYLNSDWETNAINFSQLPYVDREEALNPHQLFNTFADQLARIDDPESSNIDAALAKLEGRYAKSEVSYSEEESRPKPNTEERWQAILAKTKRKQAASLDSGRSSGYVDEESMQKDRDSTVALKLPMKEEEHIRVVREQATAGHVTEIQKRKTGYRRVEAKSRSRRSRWQNFRSISRLFESQPWKKSAHSLTVVRTLRDVESDFEIPGHF